MFKKTLFAVVSAALLSGTAFNASAADEGHGTVTFSGLVITAPCSIAPGDDQLDVPLGEVADTALNGGKFSLPADFTIHLQDCTLAAKDTEGNTTILHSKVNVTFTSANVDSTDSSLMANTVEGNYGGATGVGVRILDSGNNEIELGKPFEITFPDTNSYQELNFKARMESLAKNATEGNVASQANYVLTYN
ncbi:MAG: fimbrial-like protein [Kluyvera sp.]|uniref:fimbrial-like protein n=1 Tax=Kluyvera sp. TaxID=1538228 RepID=UPI003A886A7B